jgi:uncharacterized membrane protein YjgN (DUF898 family)
MENRPAATPAINAAAAMPGRTLPFEFTGSGGEYFRIWIVNLVLSVLTLGIYSAWAKVRRNRYFYGHTRVADSSFEYLAEPMAILKGRLIATGLFLLYTLGGSLWLPLQFVFLVLFVAAVPWLIVRSLAFRARYTAFRNIRFNYSGKYREALGVYVLLPILIVLTLGLIFPYIVYRQKRFIVERSAYGTARFTFNAKPGDFYRLYLLAIALFIGAGLLAALVSTMTPWLAPVLVLPLYLLVFAYVTSQTANCVFNNTRLEMHGFRSFLKTEDVFKLYLVNTLGIVFTLGLYTPWAQVRLARYRAEHLTLVAVGDINHFVASEQKRIGSAGEEVGEMFDIDIGL